LDREQKLADRTHAVVELDQQLGERTRNLSDKDREIARLDSLLETRQASVPSFPIR